MKISKANAEQIALKLTEKFKTAMVDAHSEYRGAVAAAYVATIPAAITEQFKKHSHFFSTVSTVRIDGHGFNRESVSLTGNGSVIGNSGNYYAEYEPTAEAAKKLIKAQRKYTDAKKHYETIKQQTEAALLALGTYKNIAAELPVAKPYLPSGVSTAIVPQMDKLRKELAA